MRLTLSVFVLLLVHGQLAIAQSPQSLTQTEGIHGAVEVGGLSSSITQTPFWLHTNTYGIVPLGGAVTTARVGLFRDYAAPRRSNKGEFIGPQKRFDWGAGLLVVANTGPVNRANPDLNDARQVLWPEVFAKIRFGQVELSAGRRKEVYGLGDTTLTSGFVGWSGNAAPLPKVQIHTPGFVPIGGWLRKAVAFRFGYAHGWFTDPNIQDAYLHQKYLYVKFGKPTSRLSFTMGLNHQVEWGGHAEYLKTSLYAVDGQLPSTFRDYVSVVSATYPADYTGTNYTDFDGTNRVGNHVGSIDFSLDWTDDRRSWLLYHNHIYEDASGISFQNIPDGLTGLRWLNRQPATHQTFRLVRVVLEWLATTNQSGDNFNQRLRYQGRDNYFNHSQYITGWSYQGRTIGTPFISNRTLFTDAVNAYIGGGYFSNNRLVMWYGAAEALLLQHIRLTTRLSWSRNFGTYNLPYPMPYEQVSAVITAQGRLPHLPNIWLSGSLAFDQGSLYPNSVGGFLSLQKRW